MQMKAETTGRNDQVDIYLYDGSSWNQIADQDVDEVIFTWYNYSVESTLDSWEKIDSAELYVQYDRSGGPSTENLYIKRSCLVPNASHPNYHLDLEIQWTSVNYSRTAEELCIMAGPTEDEDIEVYAWNGSWNLVLSDLTANSWNNVSVSDYLTSSTFTVRFLGGNASQDSNNDTWEIDCSLLHTWTAIVPPAYSDVGYNSTLANRSTQFSVNWTDSSALDWCGFTHNNSGSWSSNITIFDNDNTNTTRWANYTLTLNGTIGQIVGYRWFCNDTNGYMNDTGVFTFYTMALWWDQLEVDSRWGWQALVDLVADYYGTYGNLTGLYETDVGASTTLYPHLFTSSLAMYKLTSNVTYLNYAKSTADDMFTYAQNSTTKLLTTVDDSTGNLGDSSITDIVFRFVAELALLNSSYVDEYEDLANAIIQYYIGENDNYTLPVWVYQNGTQKTNAVLWVDLGERIVDGLLWGYLLTSNSTYLNYSRDIIVEWWSTRDQDGDPTTNLVPDKINAENKTWLESFTRQYSQGSFLRMACFYYFFDENSTIFDIINASAQACADFIHDGNAWDYRTNVDFGTAVWDILECTYPTLDYAMQMAYDIVGNSTFIERALDNFNFSFQEEGRNLRNHLIEHGTDDDGSPVTIEAHMHSGFQSIVNTWNWWYRNNYVTAQGNQRMFALYNQTVHKHPEDALYQSGSYGYRKTINSTNFEDVSDLAHLAGSSGAILPWLQFYIRPSSNVNITWMTLPSKKLLQPWSARRHMDRHFVDTTFLNVTFDYGNKIITFDEIIGSGSVAFNETILFAYRDGVEYTNYTGTVLNVTSGSHSYVVQFGWAPTTENLYGLAQPTFTIGHLLDFAFERFGTIVHQFSLGNLGAFLTAILRGISQTFTIGYLNAFSFSRFGTINPAIAMVSLTTKAFSIFAVVTTILSVVGVAVFTYQVNFFGVISQTFAVAVRKIISFSLFSTVNLAFAIESAREFVSGQVANFYGTLTQAFTVGFQKTLSFNRYPTVGSTFSVGSQKTVSFRRYGITALTFTVNSVYAFAKGVTGAVAQTFSVGSTKSMSFALSSGINPSFSVGSSKTVAFGVLSTIGLFFALVSSKALSASIFGLVNPQFTVGALKTIAFSLSSAINPTFTITSVAIFTSEGFLNFYGAIAQLFTISFQKAVSLSRFSLVNPAFTIIGTAEFIEAGFLNFFGVINELFAIGFQKTVAFNLYPIVNLQLAVEATRTLAFNVLSTLAQTFSIGYSRAFAFSLASSIQPTFTIVGTPDFVGVQFLNLYSTLTQTFSIALQKAMSFSLSSTVNPTFAIDATFWYTQTRNFFGAIAETFAVAVTRTLTWNPTGTINLTFTVYGLLDIPGWVNLFGTINPLFIVQGWADLPYVLPFVAPILEIVLVFCTAWFFTINYFGKKQVYHGIVAFMAWLIVAMLWLLIEPVGITVALLFMGIALFIFITVLVLLFGNALNIYKEKSDLD